MSERAEKRKWTGKSRGTTLGYRIFAWLLRLFGLRAAYGLLVFVVGYYMLFAPGTVRASSEYLVRRFGPMPWWRRLWRVYLHLLNFGQALIDRLAGPSGAIEKSLDFTHEGLDGLQEMMKGEQGAILLSAHIGNWDLAGRMLTGRLDKTIHVVMLQAEARHLQEFFESVGGKPGFEIIPIQEGMGAILKIVSALEKGDVVCLHGDRSLEGGRTMAGQLLGAEALFPLLPYALSSSLEIPIYRVFAVKKGWWSYHLTSTGPHWCRIESGETKKVARERWIREYTESVEQVLWDAPYQWFNFFPFWKDSSPPVRLGEGGDEVKQNNVRN